MELHYYKWLDVPSGLTVVNVGSSHGQFGFDYSGIARVKGFNFALNAQHFNYDLRILKHFSSRLAPGCVVLIPVSYFSLGISEANVKKQNIGARYSAFLSYCSIKNRNVLDYVKQRYLPTLFSSYRLSSLFADRAAPGGGNRWGGAASA